MKILLANKYYYRKGGAEQHLFALEKLLQAKGHSTVPFAMRSKENVDSKYSDYFVSEVNLSKTRWSAAGLKAAGRIFYSLEARRKMNKLIVQEQPDIAHIHNIYHQISPSILGALRRRGVPTVMTVHDFKLMCPVYIFYTQGKVCERCRLRRYYNCGRYRCAKNSYSASALNMLEMYFHKLGQFYERGIDLFITPSEFMREKLLEYKVAPEKKIVTLPNFVDYEKFQPEYEPGDYILYFGRLSKEKGPRVLIEAMREFRQVKVKIAGKGPEEVELKALVAKHKLGNIEFVGHLSGDELQQTIRGAMFTVVPTAFYEPFGLVVIESYACGKPVIAARTGALPELIAENKTGQTFTSGDVAGLVSKINLMLKNGDRLPEMGRAGRKMVEERFGPERYYKRLMEVYRRVGVK
ncbi:glycosyltransferase family 4 protein [Patescibacteria group bacterium]|nr:glycosyltransferase family 4 protein [Patescibacteria group bacterium]